MPAAPPSCPSADDLRRVFALACSAQTDGRLHEARECYQGLLLHLPNSPLLHYNLGLVFYTLEEFDQALREFTVAAGQVPEDADTLFNLALCQKKTGDCQAAIATYQLVLASTPDHADCLYNLGGCYRDSHDDEAAIACYRRVLDLDTAYLPAASNLAYLYHRTDDIDLAIVYYRQVLDERPEDDAIRYMLASLTGTPLAQAPDAYIRGFFDTYAEGFEHSLVVELGYDNPQKLYECLRRCTGTEAAYEHGIDLGCGTGLSGLPFKKAISVLDGVDLSRKMLSHAARKGCYTALHADSIIHHLLSTPETYDFFLATDVFIYIGDLQDLFTAVQAVARPDALFCFSTEHQEIRGYRLTKTGRFAYSPDYVANIAASSGWTVAALETTCLRRERGAWIAGDLWILKRIPAGQ